MSVTAWLQQDKHWHTFRSDQPIYKALWFSSVALPVDIAYVKVEGTGTRGAVFVSPGNTEPLEKYAETIFNLVEQGYAPVYGIDHRGQGRSSRLIKDGTRSGDHYYTRENTYKSHVEDRGDFVADFRQFVNANIAGLPAGKPRYILCHSMGCAVTFLYLIDEQARGMAPKFNAVAANAPLVQPTTDPFTFAQAEWIAYLQVLAGFGTSYPPTLGGTLDEHWTRQSSRRRRRPRTRGGRPCRGCAWRSGTRCTQPGTRACASGRPPPTWPSRSPRCTATLPLSRRRRATSRCQSSCSRQGSIALLSTHR